MGGFICTFSHLISLSITLQTSKFRNQLPISLKYFDMAFHKNERPILVLSLLRFSEMTSELTSSKYFELIVKWFLNLLYWNGNGRRIKQEKVQMKRPIDCANFVHNTHKTGTSLLSLIKIPMSNSFLCTNLFDFGKIYQFWLYTDNSCYVSISTARRHFWIKSKKIMRTKNNLVTLAYSKSHV